MRCHASKVHTGTSSTCLSLVQRGSYSEEHKESKETDSPLQTTMTASLSSRRGTESQWDAAVCRFVAAAHPSQTDTDGGTDRLCTAEQNSIVDFGLTETHC